jgi:WD40 repeat protein
VSLWALETGRSLGTLPHPDGALSVALGLEGRLALTGSRDGTARLWDVPSRRLLASLRQPGDVLAVALSADGRLALTGCADGSARLWDVRTGAPLGPPRWHPAPVWSVAFRHDGRGLATGSQDRTARLWQAPLPPLEAPAEVLRAWAEAVAGAELLADGTERALSADGVAGRRRVVVTGGPALVPTLPPP